MFIDELTLRTLVSDGHEPDRMGFIGFWKLIVVKNLPYDDMRRVGKIPKMLPHRLFPSARWEWAPLYLTIFKAYYLLAALNDIFQVERLIQSQCHWNILHELVFSSLLWWKWTCFIGNGLWVLVLNCLRETYNWVFLFPISF